VLVTYFNYSKQEHYSNNYIAPKKTEAKAINQSKEYKIVTNLAKLENKQL